MLEDPDAAPPAGMWRWTTDPQQAPDEPQTLRVAFENGDPVAVDGEALGPAALMEVVNAAAARHGIGRVDMVENRYLGLKSRGCYETPGGTVLMAAHRAVESLTLDREVAHLKEALMPQYATLVYNGYWFSPEREALQQLIDHSQSEVCGGGPAAPVQGRGYRGGPAVPEQPVRPDPGDFRGRPRPVQPGRRCWIHPAVRPAPAAYGEKLKSASREVPEKRETAGKPLWLARV